MSRKRLAVLAGLGLGMAWSAELRGKLAVELAPDAALGRTVTLEAEAGREGSFAGALWMPGGGAGVGVRLVEAAGGGAALYVNGEEFRLGPAANAARYAGETVVRAPLEGGVFRTFPIAVRLRKASDPGRRVLSHSFLALAEGKVEIGGRSVRVWCGFNRQTGAMDPLRETVGVDLDGDGKLNPPPTPERAVANGKAVIFRVGESYVSVDRVDETRREMVLRLHAAAEYQGIELTPGATLPDFEFTDFEGRRRKLSEFAGRHVLLDFWGSWCGPCIAEFPVLKKAWAEFRARGLEIVGIDCKETEAEGRKAAAEHGLSWTLATAESTRELVEERLRLMAFPTKVLVDGQRRIVSVVQGEGLWATLDKVLPAEGRKREER